MKVALGIPWFDSGCRYRQRNYNYVQSYLPDLFEFDHLFVSPGNRTRGSARNELVRQASRSKADVIVLCDADTFPEGPALTEAIVGAYQHGGMHFAFDKFRGLTDRSTERYIAVYGDPGNLPLESQCVGSLGGVFAIRPGDWWRAGGSPEFEGWGFEDIVFAVCSRTLVRDNKWYPGWITHLWHPQMWIPGYTEDYNRNIAICKQYESANGDVEKIRSLIAER